MCRRASKRSSGFAQGIDYQHPRGLDRKLVRTLANSEWVRQHQNLLLLGPTGIGKSWLGCALAQKARRDGFSVLHKRTSELFRELAVAHADGTIGRLLVRLTGGSFDLSAKLSSSRATPLAANARIVGFK